MSFFIQGSPSCIQARYRQILIFNSGFEFFDMFAKFIINTTLNPCICMSYGLTIYEFFNKGYVQFMML